MKLPREGFIFTVWVWACRLSVREDNFGIRAEDRASVSSRGCGDGKIPVTLLGVGAEESEALQVNVGTVEQLRVLRQDLGVELQKRLDVRFETTGNEGYVGVAAAEGLRPGEGFGEARLLQ